MAGMAVDQSERLREAADDVILPLTGGTVDQICVDFAFTLVIDGMHTVQIARPGQFHDGATEHVIDPAVPASVLPLLGLHQSVVRDARADKNGTLRLHFTAGSSIVVAPDDEYEAWEVCGGMPPVTPDFRLVCLPGGRVESF